MFFGHFAVYFATSYQNGIEKWSLWRYFIEIHDNTYNHIASLFPEGRVFTQYSLTEAIR